MSLISIGLQGVRLFIGIYFFWYLGFAIFVLFCFVFCFVFVCLFLFAFFYSCYSKDTLHVLIQIRRNWKYWGNCFNSFPIFLGFFFVFDFALFCLFCLSCLVMCCLRLFQKYGSPTCVTLLKVAPNMTCPISLNENLPYP